VYKQLLAFFSLELLTVNFYNYVHFIFNIKRFLPQGEPLLRLLFYLHGLNRLQNYSFYLDWQKLFSSFFLLFL